MFLIPLMQLFITRVRNDINWEVLNKLSEVTPDVSHCDIERLLQFGEPVPIGDLVSWEEVLLLSHLSERIEVDGVLLGKHLRHVDGLHHQTIVRIDMHMGAMVRVNRILLLRWIVETDIHTGVHATLIWISS